MLDNYDLSERELDILRLVATGASNKQIAQKLSISSNTVKVHLRNIFGKIGAVSRTEAAMYAAQVGLVEGIASVQEEYPGEPILESSVTPAQIAVPIQKIPLNIRKRLITWSGIILFILLVVGGIIILLSLAQDGRRQVVTPEATIQTGEGASRLTIHAPMPAGKHSFGAVAYENLIYTIAGENEAGITASVEGFDPNRNKWKKLRDIPIAVADVSAAVIGGKIYVPGGRLLGGSISDQLEIYDIQTNQWGKGAPLPTPISAAAVVAYEGRLFLFGGWNGKDYSSRSFIYDPALNKWSEISPMPTGRGFASAAAVSGRVYIVGGRNSNGDLDTNEVYYPYGDNSKNDWATANPMPAPRSGMGVASLADVIHVVGGTTNGTANPLSLIYAPSSDAWSILDFSMIQPASGLGLVSLETNIYAIGGEFQGKALIQTASYRALFMIAIPFVK